MKRKLIAASSILLFMLLITACGTSNVGGDQDMGEQQPNNGATDNEMVVIEEGTIEVAMEPLENSTTNYMFILKNTSDKAITLTFSSTQEYDYVLKDSTGESIYVYSMDKMFGQMFMEKTLAAKEKYEIEVDLEEVVSRLENDVYSLEIWSAARESDSLRTSIELVINNEEAIEDV